MTGREDDETKEVSIKNVEASVDSALADIFDPQTPDEIDDYTRVPTSTLLLWLIAYSEAPEYCHSGRIGERTPSWEKAARARREALRLKQFECVKAEVDRRFPVNRTP